MDEEYKEGLIEEYLSSDGEKRELIAKLQNDFNKLLPLVGGGIITLITSNPAFIAVAPLITTAVEMAIDTKDLIALLKDDGSYKLPARKNVSKILYFRDLKRIPNFNKCKNLFEESLMQIQLTYNLESSINSQEIHIILMEINRIIKEKQFELEREKIFEEYLKRTLASMINNGSNTIDYNTFIAGLEHLKDMKLVNNKELDTLVNRIENKIREIKHPKNDYNHLNNIRR